MKALVAIIIFIVAAVVVVGYLTANKLPETSPEVPSDDSPDIDERVPVITPPSEVRDTTPVVEQKSPPEERIGSVYISSVRRASYSRPGSVYLKTRLKDDEVVNITGWKLESNNGWFIVPQAVRDYRIGRLNVEGDIVLELSHYVSIYSNKSPIDKNFRLNTCIGYLNDKAAFDPELPKDCPSLERGSYQHLSGECQDYIRSLRRCELPDPNITNSFKGDEGNDCRAFINKNINIGGCYREHASTDDFLENEWRIWINQNIFDPDHDWIRLYNHEGELMDEYIY